ncbi:PASTA domain-containing protein [Thermophilibacter sp.]
MAAPDEKDDRTVAMPADPDATVRAPADPGATVRAPADPDATVAAPADSGATQLADAAPARRVPSADALPTIALDDAAGAAPTTVAPDAADGIDALDDPYFSPAVAPADLTEAQPVVAIPSPVESLPERKRRLPRWAIALLVVALLAAAGGVAWLTYDHELWGGRTIPEVVGLSEQEATEDLRALGFSVTVEYRASDDDLGVVLDCTPDEGTRIDPSAGVTLVVAGERTIPQVVGMTVDEATSALHDAGAEDVLVSYRNSDEPAGTVLAVDPAEGATFTSSDQVTLTVAQAFAVPDVRGMSADEARSAIEAAGLTAEVAYVESDAEKDTVVSTDPEPGTTVESGATVTLSVSTPFPSSPTDLLAYFDATPQQIATYLSEQGFSVSGSGIYASGGNASVTYAGPGGDTLQVSNEPESSLAAGSGTADVLASGAGIGGVRYAFSSGSVPEGGASETEAGVRAVMATCGLEGLLDTCTQANVTLPDGADASDAHFICGYGTQGDRTWAVVIGGRGDSTHVVALAAPTAHFDGIDLSPYGGSICDYVAAADLFAR